MASTQTTSAEPTQNVPPAGDTTRPRNRHRGPRHRNPSTAENADADAAERLHFVPRGGRGGRGQPRVTLPAQPTSSTQNQPQTPSTPQEPSQGQNQSRGRGGRPRATTFRPRGRGIVARTAQGREFGGQLTVDPNDSTNVISQDSTLSPAAPPFIPSQLPPKSQNQRQAGTQPRKRRASKSTAPDLPTRIHEDIDNSQYECAVCTNEVFRNSKIWSCHTCWSVFHLSCIKKWSTSGGAKVIQQRPETGDVVASSQWRCPGCNLPQDVTPSSFTCWCGKETDPHSLPGLPPFSCGQTCSRPHVLPKQCPHPCSSPCHAGPCPPCPQMGPTQSCFCGRQEITKRCVDTDYEHGWSCGEICGDVMPCGEHMCGRSCHEGLCGACEVPIEARCYCGQVQKEIICCERGDEKTSRVLSKEGNASQLEDWNGIFDCGNLCGRLFDCGKHKCEKPCHPQQEGIPHCPRSPDIVQYCPCGKTKLDQITDRRRASCTDHIPSCNKPCLKLLDCGHYCKQICHAGECQPCLERIEIKCRCGRTSSTTVCHQGTIEPPECMRVCRVKLNCGRHECGEHCCPGEKKAAERQAARRKGRPLHEAPFAFDDGFEAEHICTRTCDRPLKCGNHTCQELCHKGPCNSCREAIFDEIGCNCGRTVLQPPLPCGTRPPPCRFPCERDKDCGHPRVLHNCHLEDESCPKCPFLTTKSCLCGRNRLKNQPCWLTDVSCGEVCGRKLKCGFHRCSKPCHRPGECEDASRSCQQLCGKEKSCSHPCSEACHSPFPCKEEKPCEHRIFITCDCQRVKQEARCGATKNDPGNTTRSLKCDDECGRLERNRRLALALNIDLETHTDDHIPYSAETLNMYLSNILWASEQEKALRAFAADPDQKRYRFKPMKNPQRAFLHALAEDFGFDSESMDPEPHRHVAIFKTPRFVMAPMKTLAECARIQQIQRTQAAAFASTTVPEQKAKASNAIGEQFNAFLITKTRFGLTIEEVRAAIIPTLSSASPPLQLDIAFLPSEEVVLQPPSVLRRSQQQTTAWRPITPNLKEGAERLMALKPALAKVVSGTGLGQLQLCHVDESLNILRREDDNASGWSQVAAKAATGPRKAEGATPLKAQNGFAVLATTASKQKQKKEKVIIEEDWEAAEEREEERERNVGSTVGSGDEMGFGDRSGEDGPGVLSFEDDGE